jgi:hypothetical protein
MKGLEMKESDDEIIEEAPIWKCEHGNDHKKRKLCSGCTMDWYNTNADGGCWHFDYAKMVNRTSVGTWQNPPYKWTPRITLDCHDGGDGRCWIKKDDPRIDTRP